MGLKINGKEVFVVVFGGASRGGTGWGITGNGKIIKIPDNNPLRDIAALAEIAATTGNAALKAKVERLVAEGIAENG
jgi:hypothetical protein